MAWLGFSFQTKFSFGLIIISNIELIGRCGMVRLVVLLLVALVTIVGNGRMVYREMLSGHISKIIENRKVSMSFSVIAKGRPRAMCCAHFATNNPQSSPCISLLMEIFSWHNVKASIFPVQGHLCCWRHRLSTFQEMLHSFDTLVQGIKEDHVL